MLRRVLASVQRAPRLAAFQVEIYLAFVWFALNRFNHLSFDGAHYLNIFLTVDQGAGSEGFGNSAQMNLKSSGIHETATVRAYSLPQTINNERLFRF